MSPAGLQGVSSTVVGYAIMHQSRGDLAREEYLAAMIGLHDRVGREAGAVSAAQQRNRREVLAREAEVLFGALNQFLETPFGTDTAAVHGILNETLNRIGEHLLEAPSRVRTSSEGRIRIPRFRTAAPRHAADRATPYLREIGFSPESPGDLFESQFIVDGGAGLDLLEHIVRDRIGIYEHPHGTHLGQASSWIFSAYNLVFLGGDQQTAKPLELCLHMSKPSGMEYAAYRAGLTGALERALGGEGTRRAELWQRKLGLGRGREFIARIRCDDPEAAERAAEALLADSSLQEDSPGARPAALLREIQYP